MFKHLLMLNVVISLMYRHLSSSRNALMKRCKIRHYKSFSKVNKNTFRVKAPYMNMEDPIKMNPKRLFRGYPKLSKKSTNTFWGLKLREICIVKIDQFWKCAWSQHWSKWFFFPNGPMFSCLKLVPKIDHDPWAYPPIIL